MPLNVEFPLGIRRYHRGTTSSAEYEILYDSLHEVVGDEGEYRDHATGVCYDIRHALMGDREILFEDNGMDTEKTFNNLPCLRNWP